MDYHFKQYSITFIRYYNLSLMKFTETFQHIDNFEILLQISIFFLSHITNFSKSH